MNKHHAGILLCSIIIVLSLLPLASAQPILTQLVNNGPTSNRINILVLSEGYTIGQQATFESDALDMVNYLLSSPPFSEYENYYNAFSLYVTSTHPGSDHPSSSIFRDTYFNSTYDSYGITRLITIPPNNFNSNYADGYGKVVDLMSTYLPETDIILMIVNDTQYGGSGGFLAISSINSAAPEIVAHEIGHSFGDLNDEYEDITPGYSGSESPNTTAQTDPKFVKWTDWIVEDTPVPTPEIAAWANRVGLFEGACYEPTGWYRPMLNCKMRSLGPAYCEVCKQQFVLTQYQLVSPVDEYSPVTPTISLDYEESRMLDVVAMTPATHEIAFQWYLDNIPIEGAVGSTFNATGATVGLGTHEVKVLVRDITDFVRNDPFGLLNEVLTWTIDVTTDYICGDVNNDGVVDILDITYMVNFKFKGGPPPAILLSGDADGNGVVNVLDIIYLITFKFKSGPAPEC